MSDFRPTHRHYKGGLYRRIGQATHTETMEALVIYEDASGRVWARPQSMFYETLPDGRLRFEPVDYDPAA